MRPTVIIITRQHLVKVRFQPKSHDSPQKSTSRLCASTCSFLRHTSTKRHLLVVNSTDCLLPIVVSCYAWKSMSYRDLCISTRRQHNNMPIRRHGYDVRTTYSKINNLILQISVITSVSRVSSLCAVWCDQIQTTLV